MKAAPNILRAIEPLCRRLGVAIVENNSRCGNGKHHRYLLVASDGREVGAIGLPRGSVGDTHSWEQKTLQQVRRQLRAAGMEC